MGRGAKRAWYTGGNGGRGSDNRRGRGARTASDDGGYEYQGSGVSLESDRGRAGMRNSPRGGRNDWQNNGSAARGRGREPWSHSPRGDEGNERRGMGRGRRCRANDSHLGFFHGSLSVMETAVHNTPSTDQIERPVSELVCRDMQEVNETTIHNVQTDDNWNAVYGSASDQLAGECRTVASQGLGVQAIDSGIALIDNNEGNRRSRSSSVHSNLSRVDERTIDSFDRGQFNSNFHRIRSLSLRSAEDKQATHWHGNRFRSESHLCDGCRLEGTELNRDITETGFIPGLHLRDVNGTAHVMVDGVGVDSKERHVSESAECGGSKSSSDAVFAPTRNRSLSLHVHSLTDQQSLRTYQSQPHLFDGHVSHQPRAHPLDQMNPSLFESLHVDVDSTNDEESSRGCDSMKAEFVNEARDRGDGYISSRSTSVCSHQSRDTTGEVTLPSLDGSEFASVRNGLPAFDQRYELNDCHEMSFASFNQDNSRRMRTASLRNVDIEPGMDAKRHYASAYDVVCGDGRGTTHQSDYCQSSEDQLHGANAMYSHRGSMRSLMANEPIKRSFSQHSVPNSINLAEPRFDHEQGVQMSASRDCLEEAHGENSTPVAPNIHRDTHLQETSTPMMLRGDSCFNTPTSAINRTLYSKADFEERRSMANASSLVGIAHPWGVQQGTVEWSESTGYPTALNEVSHGAPLQNKIVPTHQEMCKLKDCEYDEDKRAMTNECPTIRERIPRGQTRKLATLFEGMGGDSIEEAIPRSGRIVSTHNKSVPPPRLPSTTSSTNKRISGATAPKEWSVVERETTDVLKPIQQNRHCDRACNEHAIGQSQITDSFGSRSTNNAVRYYVERLESTPKRGAVCRSVRGRGGDGLGAAGNRQEGMTCAHTDSWRSLESSLGRGATTKSSVSSPPSSTLRQPAHCQSQQSYQDQVDIVYSGTKMMMRCPGPCDSQSKVVLIDDDEVLSSQELTKQKEEVRGDLDVECDLFNASILSTATIGVLDDASDCAMRAERLREGIRVQEAHMMAVIFANSANNRARNLTQIYVERELLVGNARVGVLREELGRLDVLRERGSRLPRMNPSLTSNFHIHNITVQLAPRFCIDSPGNKYPYVFVVLLKAGEQVEATEAVSLIDGGINSVRFGAHFLFSALPIHFNVAVEVYAMKVNEKKRIEELLSPIRTHRDLAVLHEQSSIRRSTFTLCGVLKLTRNMTESKQCALTQVTFPLEGRINIASECSVLPPILDSRFGGFLMVLNGEEQRTWCGPYWAVLHGGCISIWEERDEEACDEYALMHFDLAHCTNRRVTLSQLHTQHIAVFVLDLFQSHNKRVVLSADTENLCMSWVKAINETLDVLRA